MNYVIRRVVSVPSCNYRPYAIQAIHPVPSSILLRTLTTKTNQEKSDTDGNHDKDSTTSDGEPATSEIVLTPGQKVVMASRVAMWMGIAVFAAACGYYIVRELAPSKLSPNRIFDRSFDVVRSDPDVLHRFGEPLKAYGRDHGGHREGRRNFVENTTYTDPQDGSTRTRVRYNLEGRHGNAFVFAEVSSEMPSGEFVYVLVQDKSNGRVLTLVDNRAALTAQRLSGGNKEAQMAMTQLLGGGASK